MNPPAGSANLVEPAGPTDPQVSFLVLREPGGKPISVFAAYSLHYVGYSTPATISADYFGMFCEELAKRLNSDQLSRPLWPRWLMAQSGDINNSNFSDPQPRKPPYK